MTALSVEDVSIHYAIDGAPPVAACDGVSFTVPAGEFVALVGRSGCGKTSMLYAIDGLLPIAAGRIRLGDDVVTGPGPDRALVFQSPTLLPWRNVLGNVTFGAEALPGGADRDRARELIDLVGLTGFERHHPHQLSGGMQQRVNLARAFAVDPDVLLLDEPFSALDAQTRELMQAELLRIWSLRRASERKMTMIFVTHDIPEAVYLANRVLVFSPRPGRIREEVTIDASLSTDPAVKRTAEFQRHVDHIASLLESDD